MVEVEVWSDFACPFCYIGKKNFETAVAKLDPSAQLKVTYRSFELDPSAATSTPVSIYERLANKYGRTIEWAREANKNVVATAAAAGLIFDMDRVKPTNTFDAHRLATFAQGKKLTGDIHDKLFSAYFSKGQNLSDVAVLTEIATSVGLDAADVTALLTSDAEAEEVRNDEARAREIGVNGVPFFVFDGTIGVSGAQPPEAFLEVFSELGFEEKRE